MHSKIVRHILLICYVAIFCGSAYAQSHPVKLKFEHDGKEVSGRFRIIFYLDGTILEPPVTDVMKRLMCVLLV